MNKIFINRNYITDIEVSRKGEISICMSNSNFHGIELGNPEIAMKWVKDNIIQGPFTSDLIELP